MPFIVGVKNKADVIIGDDDIPQIEFTYTEAGGDTAKIEQKDLLNVLSNGEKKALYTRMAAERFMIVKIADDAFWHSLKNNQTPKLVERFREKFKGDAETLKVLDRVLVVTPEHIHLNSFMYEPIIDMSGDQLRRLYADVQNLK